MVPVLAFLRYEADGEDGISFQGITANNAHSHSYPRITVYTWNRAWRFYLRQDFLIMPSFVRSSPVLARA